MNPPTGPHGEPEYLDDGPRPGSSQVIAYSWRETDRFVPRRVVRPLQQIMATGTSSAVAILGATVLAIVVANSALGDTYRDFWATEFAFEVGSHTVISLSAHEIVNDALMAVFFLLVSMEIKREMVFGDLRDPRAALLPIAAAVGGMVVPALIYASFNAGGEYSHGWGIPMATDIAFAVAVVTALGKRVPTGARVFLLTLAIVDDLGAILVIAVFYSAGLALGWLAVAAGAVGAALLARSWRVRALPVYIVLGVICWFALHESGVHSTIAGVAFGLITPAYPLLRPQEFPAVARHLVDGLARRNVDGVTVDEQELNDFALRELRRLARETQSPLHAAETRLAPIVGFLIVPVFAFANAGLSVPVGDLGTLLGHPVVAGVAIGLVVGKAIGVFGATWILARLGWGRLPTGMSSAHVFGIALCAGIGFTVALFVAGLAFDDPAVTDAAQFGIMGGSLIAAVLGYSWLRFFGRRATPAGSPQHAASSEEIPGVKATQQ